MQAPVSLPLLHYVARPPVLTPAQILGASYRFGLRSEVGWSAGTWTDQGPLGLALAGVGTPTQVTDGTNGRGRKAVLFNGTSQGYDTGALVGSDIVATGAQPWAGVVGRVVSQPAVNAKMLDSYDAAAGVSEIISLGSNAGTANSMDARVKDGNFGTFNVSAMTVPSLISAGINAGVRSFERDGAINATNGTGLSTAVAMRRVGVGAALNVTAWWSGYVWEVIYSSTYPTAAQFALLLTYSRYMYGTP